jgi:hypothetical protein
MPSLKALKGDQKATATMLARAQEHIQPEGWPENRSITVEFVSPDEPRRGPRPLQTTGTGLAVTSAPEA